MFLIGEIVNQQNETHIEYCKTIEFLFPFFDGLQQEIIIPFVVPFPASFKERLQEPDSIVQIHSEIDLVEDATIESEDTMGNDNTDETSTADTVEVLEPMDNELLGTVEPEVIFESAATFTTTMIPIKSPELNEFQTTEQSTTKNLCFNLTVDINGHTWARGGPIFVNYVDQFGSQVMGLSFLSYLQYFGQLIPVKSNHHAARIKCGHRIIMF